MRVDRDTLVAHKTVEYQMSNRYGTFRIIATAEIWNGSESNNFSYAIFLGKDILNSGYYRVTASEIIWALEAKKVLSKYIRDYEDREQKIEKEIWRQIHDQTTR
jgi:hypothetical protein